MTRFVSLFSGAGGFDLGLEAAGWECVAQCEIEPACNSVLEHHWPDVPRWTDITTLHGADLPDADVVAFGSPCQDLSNAGRQAGLDGHRSKLFFDAMRVIREMRDAGRGPRFVIWENVAGALSSSGGEDFGRVLEEMAASGAVAIEWRLLDARFFGVPQRRRRVFVVADFDHRGGSGRTLFPVGTRRRRNPQPRRQEGQEVAALTANGVGGGGGPDDNADQAGHLIPFHLTQSPIDGDGFTPALSSGSPHGCATVGVAMGVSENQRAEVLLTPYHHSLKAGGGKPEQGYPAVLTNLGVRRLTPRECERLQGWPDDHTRYAASGKELSDAPRYRMIGNGVAAPVATWVAECINERALHD